MLDEPSEWSLTTERLVVRSLGDGSTATAMFAAGVRTELSIERREVAGSIGRLHVRVEPLEPTAEITLALAIDGQGHGFATEALHALAQHLLIECALARVIAITHRDDERGHRVLGRAGFEPVAVDGDDVIFCRRGVGAN